MEAGKCSGCGEMYFPPRRVCAECNGQEFETIVLPEDGKVLTYTVIRVAPDGYGDQAPYAMAVVELANGTKIMSQVVDCVPEDVAIDMPVRIEFRKVNQDGEGGVLQYGYKCVPA
jgi:uncharacterized OB-fold protein